jgi:hypothetical protein
LLNVIINFL